MPSWLRRPADSAATYNQQAPRRSLTLGRTVTVSVSALMCVTELTLPAFAASPASAAVSALRSVNVGQAPGSVAVDSQAHHAFVANDLSRSVSIIDTSTGRVIRTIRLAGAAVNVAVDPASERLLATEGNGTVAILGERSSQLLETIALPGANNIAVDPVLHLAYVTAQNSGYLTVINDLTGSVVTSLDLRASGFAVAVDSTVGEVFITAGRMRNVMVVNEKSMRVIARIALPFAPYGVAVDAGDGQVWVSAPTAAMVVDISVASRQVVHIRHTGSGTFPEGVAIDSGAHIAYVSNAGAGTVETFNDVTAQHAQTLSATGQPIAVGVDSINHLSVVARTEMNAVTEYAPRGESTAGQVTASADTQPPVTAASASRKPLVPSDGVLLGAHVFVQRGISEKDQVSTFESDIGRKLAVDNSYVNWNSNLIGALQVDDGRNGRIPMLSWHCDLDGDGAIIDGSADSLIRHEAQEVVQYGHPVFIRWSWEMNLLGGDHSQCLGGLGAAGYVRAWQHIWTIFQQQGATNASFVWVPSGWNSGADADQYYPGARFVDWVGADGYARQNGGPSFAQSFTYFYSQWAGSKPIMITETGVEGTPREQANFLKAMFDALQTKLPDIKAVLYFDSNSKYALTSNVAQAAFAAGGKLTYFSSHETSSVPLITTSAPHPTTLGAAYSARITSTGFPVPLINVIGLPAGLRIHNDGEGTAVITGAAKQTGKFTITETAANQRGTAARTYILTVRGLPS